MQKSKIDVHAYIKHLMFLNYRNDVKIESFLFPQGHAGNNFEITNKKNLLCNADTKTKGKKNPFV